ncbi:MAG: hypothetical protein HY812_18085 [Planctomycetes bacterium]|nr:hypothetical protein [Planctomycetota bacterium]
MPFTHTLALSLLSALALVQEEPAREPSPAELRQLIEKQKNELEELVRACGARIQELESRLRTFQEAQESARAEDELDELLRLAEAAGPAPVARPSSTQSILNPNISVIPDFRARFREIEGDDLSGVFGELFQDEDPFALHGAEIELRGAVSPEADAVAILGVHGEHAEFEEAYILFHTLPWELQAKVGKFLLNFGRANQLHGHDLPQSDRPLVHQLLFGEEGTSSPGISLSRVLFTTPAGGFLPTWSELTLEAVNSAGVEAPLFGEGPINEVAGNAHWKNFWQISPYTDIEGGLSFFATGNNVSGPNESAAIVGADLTWRWRDPEPGSANSWLVQGEVIGSEVEIENSSTVSAGGGYLTVQKQLDPQWYAGIRFDSAESPTVEDARVFGVAPYVSYYLNEFIRLRLQYTYMEGTAGDLSAESHGLSAQLVWVLGAHPPHPYWVNR